MKMLTVLLLAIGLVGGNVAYAAAPNASGMVIVGTTADASPASARVGFVVDDAGHIIARIQSNATLYVDTADSTSPLTAGIVKYDETTGLALLKVTDGAASLKPYTFAHSPTEDQRKVYGIKINQTPTPHEHEVVAGAVSGVLEPRTEVPSGYYQHNALVGDTSAGGPLFNNCGEVVGVITRGTKSRSLLKRLFGSAPDAVGYAVPIEWLERQFGALGMQLARTDTVCLSESAQVESAQQAVEAAESEAESAQQAVEVAQTELDAVKNQLQAAQGASEEEKQRLQDEIDARQRIVNDASIREQAAQIMLAETSDKLRQAQVREKQYIQWGSAVLALLLVLLVLALILRRRAVNRERREKAAAQARLAKREMDEARIRRTPSVFLEGIDAVDASGQQMALRIPGVSVATAGAVIGRNPGDSDFVVNHPQVSRKHFRLFLDQDALMIEDLGSTNGTTVDGNPLKAGEAVALNDISRVECGHLHLAVSIERE